MAILAQDVEKLKAEFGDREFTGKDIARVLGIADTRTTGGIVKTLRRDGLAYQTINGWRFGAPPKSPIKAKTQADPVQSAPVVASELVCSTPSLMRIGDLLFHERAIVIADFKRQEGSDAIRLITPILEYDTTFRAVRNKVINFTKARDPREYAAMCAWLDGLAGVPPQAVDETALELAAELERKLNAANKEIAELKAKIEAIRGAL